MPRVLGENKLDVKQTVYGESQRNGTLAKSVAVDDKVDKAMLDL